MRQSMFMLVASLVVTLVAPVVGATPIPCALKGEVSLPSEPVSVRVRPGTEELWVSLQDGSMVVVDPLKMKIIATVENVGAGTWGIGFHPNGKQVYGTNWMANELVVIDAGRRTIERKINVGLKPAFISVAPDGERLYVSNFFSGELSVVDLKKNINLGDADVGRRPMGLAVDYTRKVAYLGSGAAGLLTTYDLTTSEVTSTREVPFASTHNFSLSPDGSRLIAAGLPDALLVLDPTDPTSEIKKITVGRDPVGTVFGPMGRYVFVTNYQDSTVSIVDLDLGHQIQTIPTGESPMYLALDKAGKHLFVCGSGSKSLSIYALGDERWGLRPATAVSSDPALAR